MRTPFREGFLVGWAADVVLAASGVRAFAVAGFGPAALGETADREAPPRRGPPDVLIGCAVLAGEVAPCLRRSRAASSGVSRPRCV